MVSRMVLIACLTKAKRVVDIVEQPMTSVMDRHKRMHVLNLEQVETWMGLFGAPTAKPTKLLSAHMEITIGLKRVMSKAERLRFAEEPPPTTYSYWADGRIKVQPIVSNMKKSQQYPPAYAESVVGNYLRWRNAQPAVQCDSSDSDYDDKACPATWPEAGLKPLAKTLCARHPKIVGSF